jgi:FKBP-type peptidyl-prolyl cis-trans isomerase
MRSKWINGLAVMAVALLTATANCTSEQAPAKTPTKSAVAVPAATNAHLSVALKTPVDKMSYSYGVETAKNLMKQQIELNMDAVCQGMRDAASGNKFLMNDEDLKESYAMFQSMVRAQLQGRLNSGQDNLKKGVIFLAENKNKPGVVTLPSGLQYKILKEGTGPKPKNTDIIQCNYRGTLIDGTQFDSSAKSNDEGYPATVNLPSCIAAWKEAIPMMPVGSRWQLFVPPDLAYGVNGSGRFIGSNSTLIFEVELVGILNKQ